MATDKNILRNWFLTGLKPTQAQFWAWIDAYWHKDEQIPQSSIENLSQTLNAKAEKDQFDAHLTDANAHTELFAGKEDKSNKQNSLLVDGAGKKYTTVDAVNAGLLLKADLTYVDDLATPDATISVKGKVKLAGDLAGTADLPTVPALASKQATLVSGENIKTVNGDSVLGSGDVSISTLWKDIEGTQTDVNLIGFTDGISSTLLDITAQTASENNTWGGITYGNDLFVAVASDGINRIMTSPDGITWTARAAAEDSGWARITYGNGLFVAVAQSGINRVMTSPDGITWTARSAAENNVWTGITYGNGLFVAVSIGGVYTAMTSPDGITWTGRSTGGASSFHSIAFGNGLFVAVRSGGTYQVFTSPDGITWTPRTAAEVNFWGGVTYGNGLFVAVGVSSTSNNVMSSPDGITWTSRPVEGNNAWTNITYGGGLFVATSDRGDYQVMSSPDGITWTPRVASEDIYWSGVIYGNDLFVAVGYTGINRVMKMNTIPERKYENIVNRYKLNNKSITIADKILNIETTVTNDTAISLSGISLNEMYPNATLGFKVQCLNLPGGALIYEKTATDWVQYSVKIAVIPV